MRRISVGLGVLALTTLMIELALTRIFDVILHANMAYMIITCAMFAFGLAGIFRTLRPLPREQDPRPGLAFSAIAFALAILVIRPAVNGLPFNYRLLADADQRWTQVGSFLAVYFVLALPFFISGLVFTTIFSTYVKQIRSLYFWDLCGAGLGCLLLVPLLPPIGPGGILYCGAGLALVGAACFSTQRSLTVSCVAGGLFFVVLPFLSPYEYYAFDEHLDKRGVREARDQGRIELTRWDPISKIDIVDSGEHKHIAYDGGQQSSWYYRFDGDLAGLRNRVHAERESAPFYREISRQFWRPAVLASHYLKRDSGHKALVIGCAGGHEAKAALMYGAAHIDAVEMVRTVVDLGTGTYAGFTGRLLENERVDLVVGEGRSYLQAGDEQYDVIQIFSNSTSSSLASGGGAMKANYLQTVEAYEQYFSRLTENGVLHINFYVYPRMIPIAARAWRNLGRDGFRRHVLIFEDATEEMDNFPTLLVKMRPWTMQEIEDLREVFRPDRYQIAEHPLDPAASFLSDEFYAGAISDELAARVPFRIDPPTDDRPFYNFMRERVAPLEADPAVFLNASTAGLLNAQLALDKIPMDSIHLLVTAGTSLFYGVLFIVVPLFFSEAGRSRWRAKGSAVAYFSCLGAGFIMLELVFIQLFLKLIGYPLYTYSAVIFTMLLAAGLGSEASGRLGIGSSRHWGWAFAGVLVTGLGLWLSYPTIFDAALTQPTIVRIAISCALIFPVSFFLGMPFPLGLLAIADGPRGAVAWAWGMNGLFTLIGGLASVLLAVVWGLRSTILVALGVYVLGMLLFPRLSLGGREDGLRGPEDVSTGRDPLESAAGPPLIPQRHVTEAQPSR